MWQLSNSSRSRRSSSRYGQLGQGFSGDMVLTPASIPTLWSFDLRFISPTPLMTLQNEIMYWLQYEGLTHAPQEFTIPDEQRSSNGAFVTMFLIWRTQRGWGLWGLFGGTLNVWIWCHWQTLCKSIKKGFRAGSNLMLCAFQLVQFFHGHF